MTVDMIVIAVVPQPVSYVTQQLFSCLTGSNQVFPSRDEESSSCKVQTCEDDWLLLKILLRAKSARESGEVEGNVWISYTAHVLS